MRAAKPVYLYSPKGEYLTTYRSISEFALTFNLGSNVFSPSNNKKDYFKFDDDYIATLSRVNKSTVQKWLGIKVTKAPKNNSIYTMDIIIRNSNGDSVLEAIVGIDSKMFK